MFFIASVPLLLALPVSSSILLFPMRNIQRLLTEVTQCAVLFTALVLVVRRREQCRQSASSCCSSKDAPAYFSRPSAFAPTGPRATKARQAPGPTSEQHSGGANIVVPPSAPSVRQDSKQPVQPPSLVAKGFPEQVDELLMLISPTAECERVVQELAQTVRTLIRKHWPSASVHGVTCGEITQCTSFGVAVPEVDITVKLRPHELAWPLQARLSRSSTAPAQTDVRKLQKSAIRICTDLLVSEGGFKFRRSAFRGKEPKVTLMAPRSLGFAKLNIPIDLSVNAATPLCNASLLTEIGRLDPRAKALALLVRRWAKDRGICHAAKGHLPPYAWTLLTIYFLQVGSAEYPLLPPLNELKIPTGPGLSVWADEARAQEAATATLEAQKLREAAGDLPKPVGVLFQDFIRFYRDSVDWKAECISTRHGQRAKLELAEDGVEATLIIEDPFAPSQNVGQCLSAEGLSRLEEELRRAQAMMESTASLTELLCPWVPPDQRPALVNGFDQDDDEEEEVDADEDGAKGPASTRTVASAAPGVNPGTSASLTPPPGLQLPPGLDDLIAP